jgi:fumarate reductase subunit C
MGIIATAQVVTGSDRAGRPQTIQPGNQEWVTIIECINALGLAIPPLVILKAIMHQATWYNVIPQDWSISVSENGWTTDKIGLT